MTQPTITASSFARQIIEGPGGMNDYEEREVVVWPTSERVAAAMWTLRCLANPACEGSAEALDAIIKQREAKLRSRT